MDLREKGVIVRTILGENYYISNVEPFRFYEDRVFTEVMHLIALNNMVENQDIPVSRWVEQKADDQLQHIEKLISQCKNEFVKEQLGRLRNNLTIVYKFVGDENGTD